MPRVVRIDRDRPEPSVIAEAAAVLTRGGLVAFPTETVYGLGARGLHADDVAKIFAAKERPTGHPLILHVDGEPMARRLASRWPEAAARLAKAMWPGPLTLVVPRAEGIVPDASTGGLPSVGVRMPVHPVALALVTAVGEPLAAPSANAHMFVSPTTAAHVVRSLGDRVDLVLDAGPTTHGIESTVVDVTADPPHVLRAGAASLDALRAIEPRIVYDLAALTVARGDAPRASPGMASKHYAPTAKILRGGRGALAVADARRLVDDGARVALLLFSDEAHAALEARDAVAGVAAPALHFASVARLPSDAEGYGRGLFAALYDADEAKADVIVVEAIPEGDERWWAVADRLKRAGL